MDLTAVPIDKPEGMNVIVGQAHFIKTVDDLHEALVGTSPHLRDAASTKRSLASAWTGWMPYCCAKNR